LSHDEAAKFDAALQSHLDALIAEWEHDRDNTERVFDQRPPLPDSLDAFMRLVETMLREAAADITAFADFPVAHWKKIWSTNPLERLNKEIKRRTDVVGVFPNPAALLRLAGSVLVEAHDEWQVADKRYLSETSLALLDVSDQSAETIAPTAALTA
ncbi:transposase, partial [Mycobacterium avium]|uniref:transposase n=1 Tax=Mycobacterium avium TaxID=1764 RepID=UPI000AB757EA